MMPIAISYGIIVGTLAVYVNSYYTDRIDTITDYIILSIRFVLRLI